MPQLSQMPDLILEEKPVITTKNPKNKARAGGLIGLGLLALCGLCCSVPLLAGGGLALSGAAILACLTSLWPLALAILLIAIGGVIVMKLTSRRSHQGNSYTKASEAETCNTCNLDGSCGCKN